MILLSQFFCRFEPPPLSMILNNLDNLSTFESKNIHKKRNSCFHRIPMIWNLQWLTRYSLEDWRKWSDTVWLELQNESPFCYLAVQIEIFELAELINWNLNICFEIFNWSNFLQWSCRSSNPKQGRGFAHFRSSRTRKMDRDIRYGNIFQRDKFLQQSHVISSARNRWVRKCSISFFSLNQDHEIWSTARDI